MMQDNDHPFFRPLWRRVAIVAVCLVWAFFEWWHGQTVWVVMTLAIAAYAIWVFFVKFDPRAPEDRQPPQG